MPFLWLWKARCEKSIFQLTQDYGNMVSVSVPFGLSYSLDHGLVKEAEMSSNAWGLQLVRTVNMLALKL